MKADQNHKYPKSVFFIIGNEFCERFSYYGMRTILVIYLVNALHYTSDEATVIYHGFAMFAYFFPLLGALIADSFLGKFRTIFYVSILYSIGNIVVAVASATEYVSLPAREVSLIGLLLISIGTGGIKPCVSAFGGDQFILPQQDLQLQRFFSLFYFSINAGSLISTILTPILREDISCLNQETCFPLAFGVPALLMIVATIIFVCGRPLYAIKAPEGNIMVETMKCIGYAIRKKIHMKNEKRKHFLDYADDKYSKNFIKGLKAVLRVLVLFLPLPVFWALFDQQGSRWTIQATRMDGQIGPYIIKPDQMQVINPSLILLLIPIFQYFVYPLLAKINLLQKPLQRIATGGFLAAVAFVISAMLEFKLEPTYVQLPTEGQGHLRILNGLNCSFEVTSNIPDHPNTTLSAYDSWTLEHLKINKNATFHVDLNPKSDCSYTKNSNGFDVVLTEKKSTSYFIVGNSEKEVKLTGSLPFDHLEKSDKGLPLIKILGNVPNGETYNVSLISTDSSSKFELNSTVKTTDLTKIEPGNYSIVVNNKVVGFTYLHLGGVYSILLSKDDDKIDSHEFVITQPNEIHMLWQVPQYIVITVAEIMFSITGLEFSFTQAPISMKSILSSVWLLTVAFGNLIVVIVAEINIFGRQSYEFLLFAGLMVVDVLVFMWLASSYKYVSFSDNDEKLDEKETTDTKGQDNSAYNNDKESSSNKQY